MKRKTKLCHFDSTHHCIRLYLYMGQVLGESNTKYTVAWYQYVRSDGTVGGIGSFNQHLTYVRNYYHRKGYANAMKKRIIALNSKYLEKLGASNS